MAGKGKSKDAELRFRSRSEHTLDAKGRLNIPSRFREVLRRQYDDCLVVINWEKSLKAYPVPEWKKVEDKLLRQAPNLPGFGDFVRYVISSVVECSLDRQGRILIPATMRQDFGIDSEVVLNGMLDHFEIWDKGTWTNETRRTRDRFGEFAQGISELGIL
ncbi:MAG: division/cell wall cluster transcriptional repressor MraZ [Desulfobulbaceae bacterium]